MSSQLKVLIVDDCPDLLAVARSRLGCEDVQVLCAPDGHTGIELARGERPDLILLDVEMPDMSGFDVCRRLKSDVELMMIPVIFLSAAESVADKVQGLDLGAVDYVTKPFDAFELRARVRAALRMKRVQDLLITHASIDPLTGLPNRRALTGRLRQEWLRVSRRGGSLALVMADLDNFKKLNDRHGHPAGDRMLQAVAGAIRNICRESDLPARYGGEEFAILLPDQDARGAAAMAERCRVEIEALRITHESGLLRLTVSMGVADGAGASTPEQIIERADKALYRAKESGRNRVHACEEPRRSRQLEVHYF